METLTFFLLRAGDFVLAAWEQTATLAERLWGGVDAVLNPVLSPVLAVLNPVARWCGDATYGVVGRLPVWLGITVLSAALGIVMLLAFRYTSNQDAIARLKDEIKAHLLALKLYKDELRVVLVSQIKLLWAIVRLQRYLLTPILILSPPMLMAFAQMGARYQWRPLRIGESTLLTAYLAEDETPPAVQLEPCPGVAVDAGPVCGGGRAVWRIRAVDAGRHELRLQVGNTTVTKDLVIGDGLERVSPVRPAARWTDQLLYPMERALARTSPVVSAQIDYPSVASWVHGADYWLLYLFIVSMGAALLLKPVFKVRF